jgi:integrase
VDAERLRAIIQLELTAGTFDYARRFPNSSRVAELGLKPAHEHRSQNLQEFGESAWLAEKKTDVKRSTFIYYSEVFKAHVQNSESGGKLLAEIADEDVNRWKLEMESRRTVQREPPSTRRKNMALDALCQILRLAKRRNSTRDKLLIDTKPFKSEKNEGEVNPFSEEEIESLIGAALPWERSLLTVCFFTGMRRGEVFGLRWSSIFFDRERILVRSSLTAKGRANRLAAEADGASKSPDADPPLLALDQPR